MSTFGQEIKRLREAKGWTQTELCKKSNVNPSILSRIEAGRIKVPTEETIKSLAQALEESEGRLLALAAGFRSRDRSTLSTSPRK